MAFLDSANGRIQQQIIFDAISELFPKTDGTAILDAAGGIGWLAAKLKTGGNRIYACDFSRTLIAAGQRRFPAVEFSHCDLTGPLPYPDGFFDAAILNMAAPDIAELSAALKNLAAKIKMGGRLVMTVPNPYLTYPVAVWKRSIADAILGRKPRLRFNRVYPAKKNIVREFNGKKISSHFYTLDDYLAAARQAGVSLFNMRKLKSQTDSGRFDLSYQMFRYPLILLMEFRK